MGEFEDKILTLSGEMEQRGYKTRFRQEPEQFVANALLAREIDDRLKELKEGVVVLAEDYAMLGNQSLRRKLSLGEFTGYNKGLVGDNWLGNDTVISVNLKNCKQVTISTSGAYLRGGTHFGRVHILVNENLRSALMVYREEDDFASRSIELNERDSFVFTKPEEIKARLFLGDQRLLETYLAEYGQK